MQADPHNLPSSPSWWKTRFDDFAKKIRDVQYEGKEMEKARHPKAANILKMVGFYENLTRKLKQRAAQAGVPSKYRQVH